ncbi:MAG: diguanylate cyclase response regulator [Deltaproteobacteria bacterium]|nr:MAG: diguanylate cyclase response regulator [Deltaproteobacteria bacterium]
MKNILLVEDSVMFGKLVKSRIEESFDIPVYWAKDLKEAKNFLQQADGLFSCALLDYHLPDAPNGEIIDEVLSYGITSLVFTTDLTAEVREHVWSKKVADYILKNDPSSIDYIIDSINNLRKNEQKLVLVAAESNSIRTTFSELLYIRKYRVINASSGESALQILAQYPEIKLVIVSQDLSAADGCVICQKIRMNYKSDKMAVIGVSSGEDPVKGIQFLKNGANDFFSLEPFLVEEFYSRVNNCLEIIELFDQIRKTATTDYLTNLNNRRSFFELGGKLLADAEKHNDPVACTVMDIDKFKSVNDTYGHDVGDLVLKSIASLLTENSLESEVLARMGGEEFCILTAGLDKEELVERMNKLRKLFETTPVTELEDGNHLYITASFGISMGVEGGLDIMIKNADKKLYEAKEGGRNCVKF